MTADVADLGAVQVRLLDRARAFLTARTQRGADVALDPECYLNSWAPVPGNASLRRIAFGLRAEPARLKAVARDIAALLGSPLFAVTGQPHGRGDFDSLIVSWALASDFGADGIYRDRYLGLASHDTPRTLWCLLLPAGTPPVRVAQNVRILQPVKESLNAKLQRIAAALVANREAGAAPKRLSATVAQARSIAAVVAEQIASSTSIRRIVMPYEAQPFQHAVNLAVQARHCGIATIGYLHSAPPALPTDFMFRAGAPERLLVHGAGQAEILSTHLGWPAQRLETIASLRYLRDKVAPFAGRILLPYSFDDANMIARAFEAVLRRAAPGSMPRWEMRNHPVMAQSAPHIALMQRLNELIGRYPDRIAVSDGLAQQTLIIGATAAVIEALERGLEVVHICANPLFEKHSEEIWTHMQVEAIDSNVFRYRLRRPGMYIRLGESSSLAAQSLDLH